MQLFPRNALLLSALIATAVVIHPVAPEFSPISAAAAKSENSNGGNGGGNGGGNSGGNGQSNKGGNGKENSSNAKFNSASLEKDTERQNIHASLGGLNSLNRNTNALLNSSDPRLSGFQQWYTGTYCADDCPDPQAEDSPTSQQLIEEYLNSEYETDANSADGASKVSEWIGEHAESVGESIESGVDRLKSLFTKSEPEQTN